jgi:toxin ParE1/3/4
MLLELSDEAWRDLTEIHRYGVREFGAPTANAYLSALVRTLAQLAEWPSLGRLRTDVRPPVRLFSTGVHNIFYDPIDGKVRIIRVLHHSVDWINVL